MPPPSIREDRLLSTSLPSSLGRRSGTEGDPPLEHHSRLPNPGEEAPQPFKTQRQFSHIDNKVHEAYSSGTIHDSPPFKDRPLTVRDMEHFTRAIQNTIREMSSEFIEALTDMGRSEEISEVWEDE